MIEVVTSRNALLYRDALDDMFVLRHRILVEARGLERLRRADRRLKDRFDTDTAIHLLLTQDDGTVIGAQRLLPTTGAHVFSDVAAPHCGVRGVLRGERIVELSRACVDEVGLTRKALEIARKHMVVGLFEFCVRAGVEKVTLLMPTEILFRHLLIGLDIKPLGLSAPRDGIEQVAVVACTTQEALDAMRDALDVHEPLVHYVGAPLGDGLHLAPDWATPHAFQAVD